MAICNICEAFYDTYMIYDLDCGMKAVSYICRDCFMEQTAVWDIKHGTRHDVRFEGDKAIIQTINT